MRGEPPSRPCPLPRRQAGLGALAAPSGAQGFSICAVDTARPWGEQEG